MQMTYGYGVLRVGGLAVAGIESPSVFCHYFLATGSVVCLIHNSVCQIEAVGDDGWSCDFIRILPRALVPKGGRSAGLYRLMVDSCQVSSTDEFVRHPRPRREAQAVDESDVSHRPRHRETSDDDGKPRTE